jgi:uncharacterized protein (DUF58 family)
MPGPVERYLQQLIVFVQRRLPRALTLGKRRRWRFRRVALTRTGWTYLAVVGTAFGGAWLRDSNALLLVAGMLAGPLLVCLWLPRRVLSRLQVERRLPDAVAATDRLVVELTVTNRSRWLSALAIDVRDVCRYEGPLSGVVVGGGQILLPHLGPGASCRVVYEGYPPVRGRYLFGPLRLSTVFPLGLVWHRRTIDVEAELMAHPRLGRLTPAGLQLARHSDLSLERTRRQQTRLGVDFHGLRDWRPGDSRRSIHWRSTARRGQIVVRQFDNARGQDVALFLDLWQPAADAAGNVDPVALEKVETALSLAATLIVNTCRQGGYRLVMVVAGEELVQFDARTSASLAREALAHLAVIQPRTRSALPDGFVDALSSTAPLSTILMVSTRPLNLLQLMADREPPLPHATASRIQSIAVGTPEMVHYFSPP